MSGPETYRTPEGHEQAHEVLRAILRRSPGEPERLREHEQFETVYRAWLCEKNADGQRVEEVLEGTILTEKDRLSVFADWLHHSVTGFHALRTGTLVTWLLETDTDLADALRNEGVTLETCIRAAYLHDAGKRGIPEAVLAARPNDAECLERLKALFDAHDAETLALLTRNGLGNSSWADIEARCRSDSPRPVRLLPIRHLISDDSRALLLAQGISCDTCTLLDIIDEHERLTREYLASEPELADIAGHHHTPHESSYPLAAGTVGMKGRIAQEVLHVADIVEAISARRDYHPHGMPLVCALLKEVELEERTHQTSPFVLYRVVRALMENPRTTLECASNDPTCARACARLTAFLEEHAPDALLPKAA